MFGRVRPAIRAPTSVELHRVHGNPDGSVSTRRSVFSSLSIVVYGRSGPRIIRFLLTTNLRRGACRLR